MEIIIAILIFASGWGVSQQIEVNKKVDARVSVIEKWQIDQEADTIILKDQIDKSSLKKQEDLN